MNIIVVKDYSALSRRAARIVIAAMKRNPHLVLGCATGGTPVGLYRELARAYKKGRVNFAKVTTFNLDEYVGLPPIDPQSYHAYMEEHLFSQVNLRKSNTFLPSYTGKGMQRYEQEIKKRGGIDLQILGIGQNGHIGFNEPGLSFSSRTRVVRLTPSTRRANARFFKNPVAVPRQAMTMGLGTIMEARTILLLARGKEKQRALRQALYGPVTPRVPASILRRHPSVTVVCDRAAKPL